MKLVEATRLNLLKLVDDLRYEDELELRHSFGRDFKEKFVKISIAAKEKYFLADESGNPLTIGGVEDRIVKKLKIGRVWLISAKRFSNNKLELARFIKNKIEDFKENHDILFNVIYKSNFIALRWLTRCGFKVIELENRDYKLFYFIKGGKNFDLRYITR